MRTIKLACVLLATALAGCATLRHYDEPAARVSGEGQDSTAAWTALDPDTDGSLSVDELEQQRAMGLMQDWANVDTDGDGRISRTEWDAWWPRMTDHYVRENGGNEVAFDSIR